MPTMNKNIKSLNAAYQKAASAKVGDIIICPSCSHEFEKKNYQTKFCKRFGKTVCKDHYWNNVTETKRNNTTRISPANSERMLEREDRIFYDDDPGWDAHKGSF